MCHIKFTVCFSGHNIGKVFPFMKTTFHNISRTIFIRKRHTRHYGKSLGSTAYPSTKTALSNTYQKNLETIVASALRLIYFRQYFFLHWSIKKSAIFLEQYWHEQGIHTKLKIFQAVPKLPLEDQRYPVSVSLGEKFACS